MTVIWTPNGAYSIESYLNEADLENAILQVQADLFGHNRIYLDIKKKIGAKGGLRNIIATYFSLESRFFDRPKRTFFGHSSDFIIVQGSDECSTATMNAGAACRIEVVFAPSTLADRAAAGSRLTPIMSDVV